MTIRYMALGLTRDKVLKIVDMTRHQFYHQSKGVRSGRRKSTITLQKTTCGIVKVENSILVSQMKSIQMDPDIKCGYKRMCFMLMLLGYYINKKKVARLMKENDLSFPRVKSHHREFAKYRIVIPSGPLQVIEMDIKHIWIESDRRSAYILTIIDTFTRVALHWQVGFTMKSSQVKLAWESVILNYLQPYDMLLKKMDIEVRNDNGPQFKSTVIQEFFKDNYLHQVFTHPYTPQENGHIESFHKTLSNALDSAYWSLSALENRLAKFYEAYNHVRVHNSIAGLPPQLFWDLWNKGNVERIELPKKKIKFKLNISYQEISGTMSQRETSCNKLNGAKHSDFKEVGGHDKVSPALPHETSVY